VIKETSPLGAKPSNDETQTNVSADGTKDITSLQETTPTTLLSSSYSPFFSNSPLFLSGSLSPSTGEDKPPPTPTPQRVASTVSVTQQSPICSATFGSSFSSPFPSWLDCPWVGAFLASFSHHSVNSHSSPYSLYNSYGTKILLSSCLVLPHPSDAVFTLSPSLSIRFVLCSIFMLEIYIYISEMNGKIGSQKKKNAFLQEIH
jgi:hypothetical protein